LVKPISNSIIRDEQDLYDILINKEDLEYLFQEYEKHYQLNRKDQQQVCYDENTPCVPNNNSNKKMIIDAINYNNANVLHKGENRHSKNSEERDREQQILLKDNKETIIDFIIDNKESIKVKDLKIYEPMYKCYRENGIVIFVILYLILFVQIVAIMITKKFGYV